MKKKILGIFVCTLLIAASAALMTTTMADWQPGDDHKMHFPQTPKTGGWDVEFAGSRLADDWMCSETGPVTDIHFWISWMDDNVQPIDGFWIGIWSNQPVGPNGYSVPDDCLWYRAFTADDITIIEWSSDLQGWFMPPGGGYILNNHIRRFQVNIEDIQDPFTQHEDTIYWLEIDFGPLNYIGWKETDQNWNDDAVIWAGNEWCELIDPIEGTSIDLAFVIAGEDHCNLTIRSVTGGFLDTPQTTTVDAVLANTGNASCYNVTWSFTFNGGIILSGPNTGTIPIIPPGGTVTVSSALVIGLVIPSLLPGTVTVTAMCPPGPPVQATKNVLAIILLCKVS